MEGVALKGQSGGRKARESEGDEGKEGGRVRTVRRDGGERKARDLCYGEGRQVGRRGGRRGGGERKQKEKKGKKGKREKKRKVNWVSFMVS